MAEKDQDARERIIEAAIEIMKDVPDIDKITVRQIAERAHVGIGTLNYHFNSKDNLLGIAVGKIMSNTINDILQSTQCRKTEPTEKLRNMLKEVCNIGASQKKLTQFMLVQLRRSDDMKTPLYLIPFLREIYGDKKQEAELRIIALQLLQPIQTAGISPSEFLLYTGIDFYEETQRNKFIDLLVNNLIEKGERTE